MVKVLFAIVHVVFATPATETVVAVVIRPSSSTEKTGTREA